MASVRPCSRPASVSSSSTSQRSSTGLNLKYFVPGIIGSSVRSAASVLSTSQALSMRTRMDVAVIVALSKPEVSLRFVGTIPVPRLTTTSMGRSGHRRLASITASMLGLLHVTAPSCQRSSPMP